MSPEDSSHIFLLLLIYLQKPFLLSLMSFAKRHIPAYPDDVPMVLPLGLSLFPPPINFLLEFKVCQELPAHPCRSPTLCLNSSSWGYTGLGLGGSAQYLSGFYEGRFKRLKLLCSKDLESKCQDSKFVINRIKIIFGLFCFVGFFGKLKIGSMMLLWFPDRITLLMFLVH